MTIRLHPEEIEKLLEECMPLYQARCNRLTDGSFAFQFKSRSSSGAFSIVGIRATDCYSQEQILRLGKTFLEDLALAENASLPPKPQVPSPGPEPDKTLGCD
ncbi:MAG: hypothetical protein V4812_13580 [Pseudomonadota bacterium]